MKLSRKAHYLLERFFREHFNDAELKLPEIELYSNGGARLVTKILKIYGITFGRFIFIKPELISRNRDQLLCISRELLAHETTHVLQYQKLGAILFLYTYLKAYFRALRKKKKWDFSSRQDSYLEIPHEVEARMCGRKFIEWLEKTDNEKWNTES